MLRYRQRGSEKAPDTWPGETHRVVKAEEGGNPVSVAVIYLLRLGTGRRIA